MLVQNLTSIDVRLAVRFVLFFFFFSSRRRHTRLQGDSSSDVCSSDLNTLWWVGIAGLDGLRQDALPYVPRRFWRAWMAAIKREDPELRVVGEMFDGDPAMVSFFQGGQARFDGVDSGVDTVFDF